MIKQVIPEHGWIVMTLNEIVPMNEKKQEAPNSKVNNYQYKFGTHQNRGTRND